MDSDVFDTLLAEIITVMTANETSLTEDFFEMLLNRLVSFGYTLQEGDCFEICFNSQKVENHIKNNCNINAVPEGLYEIAVDRICGEFFFGRHQTGSLVIADLDLDGMFSSIKEGDTQVNFSSDSSEEAKFNSLVQTLRESGEGDLVCYRKIKW